MARARSGQPGVLFLDEVCVVAIAYLHDYRAARADPFFYAAQELHLIVLYVLATAAPIAALSAGQVPVYLVGGQRKARGKAFRDNREARSVRFAAGQKPVHHIAFTSLREPWLSGGWRVKRVQTSLPHYARWRVM